jgi:hypothetical protein
LRNCGAWAFFAKTPGAKWSGLVSSLINVRTLRPGLAQQVEEFIFGFELAERGQCAVILWQLNPPSEINSISSLVLA